MKCVSCDLDYVTNANTGDLIIHPSDSSSSSEAKSTSSVVPTKEKMIKSAQDGSSASSTVSFGQSNDNTAADDIQDDDYYFLDAPVLPAFRSTRTNDASTKIAKHLMEGWALLDQVTIFFRSNFLILYMN